MARRRAKTSATGGNLDSMLDTLTNVVGILVIVLVTVQLSSQEAASRIADAIEKVDPADLARLEKEAAEARTAAEKAAQEIDREKRTARDPKAEAAKLEAEAKADEQRAKELAERTAAVEKKNAEAAAAAAKAAANADAERAKREKATRAAEERRKELQATLDNLPVLAAAPAKEVRLPDPRPAPSGAKELRVLCREGRIWVVDVAELQEPAKKRAEYVVRQKKLDPDGDTWLTDGTTFVDEFNDKPVREDGLEMTLALAGGKWPQLVLTRMPGSGETAEEATKASGRLAKTLRKLKPDTHIVRFFVWPDGFDAYLAAREFVGGRGFSAGWEPVGSPEEHRIGLGKYAVGQKPPPTPPGTAPPPKPPANVID